ncbi:MAG: hypothetical protein E5Y12_00885 [Mesorhizobium sp.]|nr:MAG: hypothetical protein E5Y12_00885 [Mesorhizobium sp.]
MDADRWERSCAQVQFFQMNGSAIHAAFPMKQSRRGESKERLVDILVYGWATSKHPDIPLLARGMPGGETAKCLLPD